MSKIYLINKSDKNKIVMLSNQSVRVGAKSFIAVSNTDLVLHQSVKRDKELELSHVEPKELNNEISDVSVITKEELLTQDELKKTAQMLQDKLLKQESDKKQQMKETATKMLQEQTEKEIVKTNLLLDTAKAMEKKLLENQEKNEVVESKDNKDKSKKDKK